MIALGGRSVARSHIGAVRAVNEDRILNAEDRGLWAVADGMGGHTMGDVAAEIVVAALADCVDSGPPLSKSRIEAALCDANGRVFALNSVSGRQTGSTVAGLGLAGSEVVVFWAGDSRVYRCRDGDILLLTHDHRVVQELVDAGVIDASQARGHPQSTVITRAVGGGPTLDLDMRVEPVYADDIYLICSDGLSDLISSSEMAAALVNTPANAADMLIQLALAAGGVDNISLLVIVFETIDDQPARNVPLCATRL